MNCLNSLNEDYIPHSQIEYIPVESHSQSEYIPVESHSQSEYSLPNIDQIYFINLSHRKDRLESFLRNIEKLGLPSNKIIRIEAISTPGIGYLGCSMSHELIYKIAHEKGFKNIMIFEDDFEALVDKDTFHKNINRLFENNLDFKVVMMSYLLKHNQELTENNICDLIGLTKEAQTTSGYILNCKYLDQLKECVSFGVSMIQRGSREHWKYTVDQIWKRMQMDKWYYFKQPLGRQLIGSKSDC